VVDGAGVADGDAVVGPAFGGGEDMLGHLLGGHGGTGWDLDGNTHVGGGDFDVGATDVEDENFHEEKDTGSGGLIFPGRARFFAEKSGKYWPKKFNEISIDNRTLHYLFW
jgi:hypothetical protein